MNEVLAIGLVAACFVAFGLLSRGKGVTSCHAGCEHETDSAACATCAIAGREPPVRPSSRPTIDKNKH